MYINKDLVANSSHQELKILVSLVDYVRIDHFRGFESYWTVPFGSPTAENGKWEKPATYLVYPLRL